MNTTVTITTISDNTNWATIYPCEWITFSCHEGIWKVEEVPPYYEEGTQLEFDFIRLMDV